MLETALDALVEVAGQLGFGVTECARHGLTRWAELVVEWREPAALTSLRASSDVVSALMTPALYALRLFDPQEDQVIVDLGAGSGATGAALAAISGRGRWRLVDRSRKKITFCRYAIGRCRIPNVTAEEFSEFVASDERADLVLARGLPKTAATSRSICRVSRPAARVMTWVAGDSEPEGVSVRCGSGGLWIVSSDVECFT
jgi:16S rRNA G527 N7-methylase RsmG